MINSDTKVKDIFDRCYLIIDKKMEENDVYIKSIKEIENKLKENDKNHVDIENIKNIEKKLEEENTYLSKHHDILTDFYKTGGVLVNITNNPKMNHDNYKYFMKCMEKDVLNKLDNVCDDKDNKCDEVLAEYKRLFHPQNGGRRQNKRTRRNKRRNKRTRRN